jgi:uncharacterized protein YoxC
MRKRRTVAWLVAVVVGLTLVPATEAMAASAHEKAQNARIAKVNKRVSNAIKKATKTANTVATLTGTVGNQAQALVDLTTLTGDINTRLKAIEAGVPAVFDALTKLGTAAQQLKDGLTAAGAGLTSLKTLVTSTEYGIGQVFIAGNPAGGAFVVTPDIPDAVQQAQTSQTFIAGAAGALTVKVGVRSAETDGTGASNPAADCRVTVTAGNTGTTSTPNAGIGGAPFYPIDNKSPQTSSTEQGFPFGPISTDQLTDLTAAGNSASPAGAATATAGLPYQVTLSCVDLSPSATDPSA